MVEEVNDRIARRIRALRLERELSLEALAARSQVSRSMLSLVERAESSPTAVVLDKIATGLGVPLAALFDAPAAPPSPVARASEQITWRDPETGYVRRSLSPAAWPSPLRLVEVTLPAGARVAYETGAREAPFHQQVWILAGVLELGVGARVERLEVGDCCAMVVDAPTTFTNPSRGETRYLVALATERTVPR